MTAGLQDSGNVIDSSLKAPAIYLRACIKFAIGKCLEVSTYTHHTIMYRILSYWDYTWWTVSLVDWDGMFILAKYVALISACMPCVCM